jgi:hypothetical protein
VFVAGDLPSFRAEQPSSLMLVLSSLVWPSLSRAVYNFTFVTTIVVMLSQMLGNQVDGVHLLIGY